ncbi:MAG: hypothetical protein H6756_12900 [Candidatus Omnitrophica bacterium]|nr:hypothetical protein [Candidatus Omnitrophota bacterium]
MFYIIANKRFRSIRQLLSLTLATAMFMTGGVMPAGAAATGQASLPAPGTRLSISPEFRPATLRGMRVDPAHPLRLEFLIDTGDDPQDSADIAATNQRLINYFLTAVTVPEDQLWVNLSPEESERIIADDLVKTEMGRDMLAMDYLLKQLMASMLYPEEGVGAEFWQRVHRRAQAEFGTTDIPTDTFNKIWIVPRQAHVHVQGEHVVIVDSELDVLLEEDYLSLAAHSAQRSGAQSNWSAQTKELIRKVVIPEIKKEINHGRHFANLRQIYHAMLLAVWYKKNLHRSIVNRMYADRNLVTGIDHAAPDVKDKIYRQYLEAFRKGAFDYIREDIDPASGDPVPRRYFSGGLRGYDQAMVSEAAAGADFFDELGQRPLVRQLVDLKLVTENPVIPAAANDIPLAALPDPDYDLFRRLERAHFDYNVYGDTREGVIFESEGFSRRVYALPQEYPHLLFKMARSDMHADPPPRDQVVQMSRIAERVGYELVTVDGIELIKMPGIAPFRYYGSTVIQQRGQPATDTAHFEELVALFARLGVTWDLAKVGSRISQLKNVALYPQEVDGQIQMVPRVTDLKDFRFPASTDQAITAKEEQRLKTMFNSLGEQTRFLWTQITGLSKDLAAAGQAEESAGRDQQVLAKLGLLLRSLLSMRELPVMVHAQSARDQPYYTTSAEGVFYHTLDDIISGIEGHITDLQKQLAPAKFGSPPDGMEQLKQGVLYLRREIIRAEKAFRTMERTDRYPVLAKASGYRVFYDMLTRDLRPIDFQSGFQGRLSGLGLQPDMPTVGLTNLRRIQEKLTRLLRRVAPGEAVSGEMREQQASTTDRLSRDVTENIVQLIETQERLQFPTQNTNQAFINSVAAASTHEVLMTVFGPLLDGLGERDRDDQTLTAAEITRAIEGIDYVERRLRALAESSDYIFVMDETTALIVAHLDIPLEIIDLAMTAEFDEKIAEQFRRVKRAAMMQIHGLSLAAGRINTLGNVQDAALSPEQRAELTSHLTDVRQTLEWFRRLPSLAEDEDREDPLDPRLVFRATMQHRLNRLLSVVSETGQAVSVQALANSSQAQNQRDALRQLAQDLSRFLGFLQTVTGLDRIPLLRSDEDISVFDEFTEYTPFIAGLRSSFENQSARYRSPLRVVGSETFELGKLEALIDDLAGVNRDLVFTPAGNRSELVDTFRGKRAEIGDQIERWAASLDTTPENFGERQEDLIRRIVNNTVGHFLKQHLQPLVAAAVDPLSIEQRSLHVQQLQLQIQSLKERLRVLAGSNHYIFLRDSSDGRLRVGIDPADMLDAGMSLRFLFSEFLIESSGPLQTLSGLLETLSEISRHTNRWITQEQIVELSERILYHLAEVRAAPSLQISTSAADTDPDSKAPDVVMRNTVWHALADLEQEVQMIAMHVRDPSDNTVPDSAARLVQNLNYYHGLFKTLAATDNFPLLQTQDGRIVFDEALTYEFTPADLQREFQWESVRLGTNMITVGDHAATPFGELNYIAEQLQFALDTWDPAHFLAPYEFGLIFGNLQPRMLAILDELSSYHHEQRPAAITSKEDLARTIALNSVDEITVQRLYGWIQLDGFGFMSKEAAQQYLDYIRQELTLAANRINSLARNPDYAFRRHDISGELTLDINGLLTAGRTDQAMTSAFDARLQDMFRRFAGTHLQELTEIERIADDVEPFAAGGVDDLTPAQGLEIDGYLNELDLTITRLQGNRGEPGFPWGAAGLEPASVFAATVLEMLAELKTVAQDTRAILPADDTGDGGVAVAVAHQQRLRALQRTLRQFVIDIQALGSVSEFPLIRQTEGVAVYRAMNTGGSLQAELSQAFQQRLDRYRHKFNVVGIADHEFIQIDAAVAKLEDVEKRLSAGETETIAHHIAFDGTADRIATLLEQWRTRLIADLQQEPAARDEQIEQIVGNTILAFLEKHLLPTVRDVDPASPEQRREYVQQLRSELQRLVQRLRILRRSSRYIFRKQAGTGGVRVALDHGEMLDQTTALRFLFGEYVVDAAPLQKQLAERTDRLARLLHNPEASPDQEAVVTAVREIVMQLSRMKGQPEVMHWPDGVVPPANDTPLFVMQRTVEHLLNILDRYARDVRDSRTEDQPALSLRLHRAVEDTWRIFGIFSEHDDFPLIATRNGSIIFTEAIIFEMDPRTLQRRFAAEERALGSGVRLVGTDVTPLQRIEADLDDLAEKAADWDGNTDDQIGALAVHLAAGQAQQAMFDTLREMEERNAPQPAYDLDTLMDNIVYHTRNHFLVNRVRPFVADLSDFTGRSDLISRILNLRGALSLANRTLRTLTSRHDYAFIQRDLEGLILVDIEGMSVADQATMSIADRLLAAHFRTVAYLGDNPSVTFTDQEVDTLMYWLDSGSGESLPESILFGKLIHLINTVYHKEKGVNGLTKEWLSILSEQLDIPEKRLKNVFRWFKFVKLDTATVNSMALAKFFDVYRSIIRKFPGVYDSFTYYVPPGTSDEEKLIMAAGNMATLTSMFSPDFINGKTVLKADIPGRDYYVGLEFGVPENGFGLNMVIGRKAANSEEPFPNVFMRIGLDTQGPDMRINFMQGVAGMESLINDEFVQKMGFHPGIALLYVATDLAYQGHVEFRKGELNPMLDPFRSLRGIRPEFIPSMRNRLSRSTINVMKGYDDFGLRKKTVFSRWRSVTDLVRVLIPQRISQKDWRARSITRLHEAFRSLKEIPAAQDEAQLSDDQRIAVLEVASVHMFRHMGSEEPYRPDVPLILATLGLPASLYTSVLELVALNWEQGVLGRRAPENAVRVEAGNRSADQAQLALTRRQKIAILEYVGEKAGTTVGTYVPDFKELLQELSIPRELAQDVYQWISLSAANGTFDFSAFQSVLDALDTDKAVQAGDTKGGIDLNPANLNLRQTGTVPVDFAGDAFPEIAPIQGVVPVLIETIPVTNLPLLLGQSTGEPVPGPSAALSPAQTRSSLKIASAPTF